ncbi:MAG: J domain-containing protein, partial [Desulforhabdus sp.]|nr:J domain-containing protein [Desulforhabdus sp.]
MNDNNLTQNEVIAAFRTLFSFGSEVGASTLDTIDLAEIKKAYRKRALATHPDRFAGFSEGYQKARSEQFIVVNDAYTTLSSFLKMKQENGFSLEQDSRQPSSRSWKNTGFYQRKAENGPYSKPHGRDAFSSFYWQKEPPQRPLRFGEYLFYSGAIPWSL